LNRSPGAARARILTSFAFRFPRGSLLQVDAAKLDQVECPHENAVVSIPSPDQLKTGDSVIATGNGFAIDDAGFGAQPRKSLDDQGEARR
jgi:hypothetical protein